MSSGTDAVETASPPDRTPDAEAGGPDPRRGPVAARSEAPLDETPPMPVIRFTARDLTLRYGDDVAFRDVSLTIRADRVTALIGPSGCGKTSFLNCLNRLTDLAPGCRISGGLSLDGHDLLDPDLDVVTLRRRVGMIFQKPNPFPTSIHRNLELPLREHGVRDPRRIDAVVERTLRDVGLWDEVAGRLDAGALGLSGGQQQRLCIARALALQPEILLLDEPCSSLDPLSTRVIEDLVRSLAGRLTLVVVTHDLAQARRIADDAAFFWMEDGAGCLVESGPAGRVLESPADPRTAAYVNGRRP